MTPISRTRLLLFCVLTAGLFPASCLLGAGTVQFPKDHPMFEAKLPAGWTTKWTPNPGNEGDNLEFDPGDGSEYALMFASVREAKDMADLKKKLPSLLDTLTKAAGVRTSVTGAIKDSVDTQHGVILAQMEAHGTGEAEGYTTTVCGFTLLMAKQCFVIAVIASKEGTQAHQKDFEAIRDSIRRIP